MLLPRGIHLEELKLNGKPLKDSDLPWSWLPAQASIEIVTAPNTWYEEVKAKSPKPDSSAPAL